MKREELEKLLNKYESGEIDEADAQVLESLFFPQQVNSQSTEESGLAKKMVWKRLRPALHPKRRLGLFKWYGVAAAMVILLAAGKFIWELQHVNQKANPLHDEQFVLKANLAPISNSVILTLDNGKQIMLNKDKSGLVMNEDGLSYSDLSEVEANVQSDDTKYLQVYAPRGSQFEIILSDGSKVWLNADSKLRYPMKFSGNKRIVHLEGEAYFEVNEARDLKAPLSKLPFIVKSGNQETIVLGTRFNIHAYNALIKTTLVSGRVNIETFGGEKLSLSPGEQSKFIGNQLTKSIVETRQAIAWMENKFSFDDKPFGEVMDELARWYDLKIEYEGDIPRVKLTGDAFRKQNINLVLRVLDAVAIKYHLDTKKRVLYIHNQ